MNPFHALQALVGNIAQNRPAVPQRPVSQPNRPTIPPAAAMQQLIRPTAQPRPAPGAPTIFQNMSFGNNRVVGKPLADNNIYANSTPDTTVINRQNVLGHARTGNPIKSATLVTPQSVRPTLQQQMRFN